MKKTMQNQLLSVQEMYEADKRAIDGGISGLELMENAGAAITREILKRYAPQHVLILCGPGNNGGDGFVVARLLEQHGIPVKILLLGQVQSLGGDAFANAQRWTGKIYPLCAEEICQTDLVVDAIFGAGLARDTEGDAFNCLKAVEALNVPILAVDVPSGVDGNSGQVRGMALQADVTVTFARPKVGHHLYPAKTLCGELVVADIGINERVIEAIDPQTIINSPQSLYPWPKNDGHKYGRGHVLILGGTDMTGAARLASLSARRIGAGLTTIACDPTAYDIYRQCEPGNIISQTPPTTLYQDPRKNVVLCGPGMGLDTRAEETVRDLLKADKKLVLDADALTLMSQMNRPKRAEETLITPHEGEFARLFPDLSGSKLERAQTAAQLTGYTVLLKGADTVISSPSGRSVINDNATPWLATAGSGDCLAGICAGLMAQGLNGFDAACLGAWIHGQCAKEFGPGLIAEDIAAMIPKVLKSLINSDIQC